MQLMPVMAGTAEVLVLVAGAGAGRGGGDSRDAGGVVDASARAVSSRGAVGGCGVSGGHSRGAGCWCWCCLIVIVFVIFVDFTFFLIFILIFIFSLLPFITFIFQFVLFDGIQSALMKPGDVGLR